MRQRAIIVRECLVCIVVVSYNVLRSYKYISGYSTAMYGSIYIFYSATAANWRDQETADGEADLITRKLESD